MITDKVGGSSAKPEVSKQSKEKRLKHKVSGYKSQSKRRSIAGCRLLLRTLSDTVKNCFLFFMNLQTRWQGWGTGESTCLPPMWPEFISNPGMDRKCGLSSGLSKVASCQQKSLPTWLVWAGYSARQFFTDAGCKENLFYSFPFGQAEASIY